MKRYVFDANPLVRLFRDTSGADVADDLITQAKSGRASLYISVVNLAEVYYVLTRYIGKERALRCIDSVRPVVEVVSIDEQSALDTAALRMTCKLGFADCFAAHLAMRLGATLVTADPEFAQLGKQLKILALPRHV